MAELKWAAQNGIVEQLREFASQPGFDVNADIGNGRSLIHIAADYGQKDALDYLISIGANVNALDTHGLSPLLNAIFEGHTACVQLLIQKGANKNIKSPSGETALQVAEKEEIKALLQ